jgi:hypothetical protein
MHISVNVDEEIVRFGNLGEVKDRRLPGWRGLKSGQAEKDPIKKLCYQAQTLNPFNLASKFIDKKQISIFRFCFLFILLFFFILFNLDSC